jgi:hypothetical protein
MEEHGQHEALEYFYLLRLFVAFFFHDVEMMEESMAKLTTPVEGVWIPWAIFFGCFLMIQGLPNCKGKKRKELKEDIEVRKGQLVDWFNEGNPNPGSMISILEAEYLIVKEKGKGLSSMKVTTAWDEAIEATQLDGFTHLEAWACERVGLHFHETGVDGIAADYLKKAHKAYDKWHGVAKVIDIESKFGDLLKIKKRRQRTASAYISQNAHIHRSENKIGGGGKEIKTPNVKKLIMNAGKNTKKGLKKSTRKVKDIFKKHEQAEPAPWGFNSKSKINDGNDTPLSPTPTQPRSSLVGLV